jgi:hypothetical protein
MLGERYNFSCKDVIASSRLTAGEALSTRWENVSAGFQPPCISKKSAAGGIIEIQFKN